MFLQRASPLRWVLSSVMVWIIPSMLHYSQSPGKRITFDDDELFAQSQREREKTISRWYKFLSNQTTGVNLDPLYRIQRLRFWLIISFLFFFFLLLLLQVGEGNTMQSDFVST